MSDKILFGAILSGDEKRDAVHVAVAPVMASDPLKPGQHVGLMAGSQTVVSADCTPIGIVDPFLRGMVQPGQWCWLFLYPQTITSLRHNWTHPAFAQLESELIKVPSSDEKWLREYASRLNVGFQDLIDSAHGWVKCGERMCRGGILEGESTSPEFWEHFQRYTGREVPEDKRSSFFTCAC